MGTATDHHGIVHDMDFDGLHTLCGADASGWSRTVTEAQRLGLALHCADCRAVK